MFKIITVLIAVLLISPILIAEVPHLISYQGVLKDSTGVPVEDNVHALKFSIYDSETEGSLLWESEGFVPIQTTDGLFNHVLGSTNPVTDSIANFENLWLGIAIGLEPELPRTQLVSVPFSISSQHADTAIISLDKTVDASELTTGTLDTERYSAYEDLVEENKIGDGSEQVAAGNHVHTGVSFPGTMVRYEDTTTVIINIDSPVETTLKTINIPSGQIHDLFRISCPYRLVFGVAGGELSLKFKANNQILISDNRSHYEAGTRTRHVYFICQRLTGNDWYFSVYGIVEIGAPFQGFATIDPSSGLNIELTASAATGDGTYTIGNLFVEYDVD